MQKKYKKLVLLGKGATAHVYLVEEVSSGKRYAMKVFQEESIFRRENEVWKILVQGEGKENDYLPEFVEGLEEEKALIIEYLEGKDLQMILDAGQTFSLEETVGIMVEVLNALQVLHKRALIYRDLKPANIMLCKDGRVRLIDLGAACLEEEENAAGTYGYAAPEQFWEGVKPEKICDIYSAGKVLTYLLTGKNPAHPPYDVEQYCKGMKKVPAEFLKIINRSLAKDPRARFADCESMKCAIQKAYDECGRWKCSLRRRKTTIIYEKCIWMSEYRRIF